MFFHILLANDDADDRIDISNSDLAVMVHIGSSVDHIRQDDLDDSIDIGYTHLAVKIHIAERRQWRDVVTGIVAIE